MSNNVTGANNNSNVYLYNNGMASSLDGTDGTNKTDAAKGVAAPDENGKDSYSAAPASGQFDAAKIDGSSSPVVNGQVSVDEAKAQQTVADLASVVSTLGALGADGTLSPEQMELMMAVMMVAVGKMDTEDAKSLIEAAESRNKRDAAESRKLDEMCQIFDLVNTARHGGCGATRRVAKKLEAMGFPPDKARKLARMMRFMPPHMQFRFAAFLVKHSPAAREARHDQNVQNNANKNPFDSKMIESLLTAQKEGKEALMDLMMLLLVGDTAANIQNGTNAMKGQQGAGGAGQTAGQNVAL